MRKLIVSLLCILVLIFSTSGLMAQTPPEEKKEEKKEVEKKEVGEKKETPSEQVLIRAGGILLPRGTLQIEPSFQYSHLSRHTIAISGFTLLEAIVIGTIAVSDVKRDIFQGILTSRYGITDRLQLEVKVQGIYRADRYVKGAGTPDADETHVNDFGFGDVEAALFYHAILGKSWIPDIVFNVRGRFPTGRDPYHLDRDASGNLSELPTGTGHWGVSGGFTAVKVSDPAVFFGSFNFYWNFARDVGHGYGKIAPGYGVEFALGVAYALSEKLSLSTQYQQRINDRTKQNGKKIPGSFVNSGVVFLGATYAVSSKAFLNVSVGIGVTADAPDVQLVLSMPFNIKIF